MQKSNEYIAVFYLNGNPILKGNTFTQNTKERSKYEYRSNWTPLNINESDKLICKIGTNKELVGELELEKADHCNKLGEPILTQCKDNEETKVYVWATCSFGRGITKIFTAGIVDKRLKQVEIEEIQEPGSWTT